MGSRFIFVFVSLACVFGNAEKEEMDFQKHIDKTFEIVKALDPYFEPDNLDKDSIGKRMKPGPDNWIPSIGCSPEKMNLPNGNEEMGVRCRAGYGSGITVNYDKKMNPININYFEP